MSNARIPSSVTAKLGYYVYAYVHPETKRIFYVGKGTGPRAVSHLKGSHSPRVRKILRGLRRMGKEPRIDILVHGLEDEKTAKVVEAAAIDLLGPEHLANAVRGHGSRRRGRMPLDHAVSLYVGEEATIREPAILIRISQLYRYGMTETELYEATRGVWKISERREGAKFAFAVHAGVVQQVYRIQQWHPAFTTFYGTRDAKDVKARGRWEFVGTVAPEPIRRRYVGRSVKRLIGGQYPIRYVNC